MRPAHSPKPEHTPSSQIYEQSTFGQTSGQPSAWQRSEGGLVPLPDSLSPLSQGFVGTWQDPLQPHYYYTGVQYAPDFSGGSSNPGQQYSQYVPPHQIGIPIPQLPCNNFVQADNSLSYPNQGTSIYQIPQNIVDHQSQMSYDHQTHHLQLPPVQELAHTGQPTSNNPKHSDIEEQKREEYLIEWESVRQQWVHGREQRGLATVASEVHHSARKDLQNEINRELATLSRPLKRKHAHSIGYTVDAFQNILASKPASGKDGKTRVLLTENEKYSLRHREIHNQLKVQQAAERSTQHIDLDEQESGHESELD